MATICVCVGGATLFGQLLVESPASGSPSTPSAAQSKFNAPPLVQYAEVSVGMIFQTDGATCLTTDTCAAPTQSKPVATPQKIDLRKLANALVQIESAGDGDRVGLHGERGLMQIKPGTWEAVTTRLYGHPIDFNRAFEKELNLKIGTAYLEELQDFLATHRESWQADERDLLLACYNAGPTRVQNACFDLAALPFQTQDYVARATALADCD